VFINHFLFNTDVNKREQFITVVFFIMYFIFLLECKLQTYKHYNSWNKYYTATNK